MLLMGKSTINGPFSIAMSAMLVYQRVYWMFSYFSMVSLRLPHASRTGDVKEELLCLIATLRKVGAGLMCGQPWLRKVATKLGDGS